LKINNESILEKILIYIKCEENVDHMIIIDSTLPKTLTKSLKG